jgi:hypothetical protein
LLETEAQKATQHALQAAGEGQPAVLEGLGEEGEQRLRRQLG